jgi:hypothetical protein
VANTWYIGVRGPVVLPGSVFVVVMSRDQNAERSHNTKTDNRSFERVEKSKCLGTTLTNQNSIQEEKFCLLLCMGVKLGRSHGGRNVG